MHYCYSTFTTVELRISKELRHINHLKYTTWYSACVYNLASSPGSLFPLEVRERKKGKAFASSTWEEGAWG